MLVGIVDVEARSIQHYCNANKFSDITQQCRSVTMCTHHILISVFCGVGREKNCNFVCRWDQLNTNGRKFVQLNVRQ